MRSVLGLAIGLLALPVRADAPRTVACVWLNETGEGQTADGKTCRLTDAEGKPYRLNGKVALTVLETKP